MSSSLTATGQQKSFRCLAQGKESRSKEGCRKPKIDFKKKKKEAPLYQFKLLDKATSHFSNEKKGSHTFNNEKSIKMKFVPMTLETSKLQAHYTALKDTSMKRGLYCNDTPKPKKQNCILLNSQDSMIHNFLPKTTDFIPSLFFYSFDTFIQIISPTQILESHSLAIATLKSFE